MSDFLKLITRIPEGENPQFLHYCVSSEGLSLHASSPSGTPIKCDKKGIKTLIRENSKHVYVDMSTLDSNKAFVCKLLAMCDLIGHRSKRGNGNVIIIDEKYLDMLRIDGATIIKMKDNHYIVSSLFGVNIYTTKELTNSAIVGYKSVRLWQDCAFLYNELDENTIEYYHIQSLNVVEEGSENISKIFNYYTTVVFE